MRISNSPKPVSEKWTSSIMSAFQQLFLLQGHIYIYIRAYLVTSFPILGHDNLIFAYTECYDFNLEQTGLEWRTNEVWLIQIKKANRDRILLGKHWVISTRQVQLPGQSPLPTIHYLIKYCNLHPPLLFINWIHGCVTKKDFYTPYWVERKKYRKSGYSVQVWC